MEDRSGCEKLVCEAKRREVAGRNECKICSDYTIPARDGISCEEPVCYLRQERVTLLGGCARCPNTLRLKGKTSPDNRECVACTEPNEIVEAGACVACPAF